MEKQMEKSQQEKIREKILSYLTSRDYSQHTLIQKLKMKGYVLDDIKTVLDELAEAGLFNEVRFVDNYIHYRQGRGYGPERIAQELRAHGIAADMIAKHLKMADNSWSVMAHKVWKKRFKGQLPGDFMERMRQMRFLQYRGYTKDQIEAIVSDNDSS